MSVQGVLRETEGHGQKFGDRMISRIHEQTGQVGGFRQTPHSGESVEKFPSRVSCSSATADQVQHVSLTYLYVSPYPFAEHSIILSCLVTNATANIDHDSPLSSWRDQAKSHSRLASRLQDGKQTGLPRSTLPEQKTRQMIVRRE